MTEFKAFPKIPRLNRDMVVTEKIDGSNACVIIEEEFFPATPHSNETVDYKVTAQSRNRIITPEKDNFGFAKWVQENAETLVADLGPGYHYGEWWGSGIQRGYGLQKGEKRFSLFNTTRWEGSDFDTPGLDMVPVLYYGPFSTEAVVNAVENLREFGSVAAPYFPKPEGVIVFHTAANRMFKVTLEKDEQPKALAQKEMAA